MNAAVTRFLHLCTDLPPIWNFNFEDEDQRHLCYQFLAVKVVIFTFAFVDERMFSACPTFFVDLLCIPHYLLCSDNFGTIIISTLFNIILVKFAYATPMQLFYVMVLFRTIYVPGLEILMDIYVIWCMISFAYHTYEVRYFLGNCLSYAFTKALLSFGIVPIWYLWLCVISLSISLYINVKQIRPLAWIHLSCSFIIWIACTYGKVSHEIEQAWICRKLACLFSITSQFYTNNSLM